MHLTNYTDYCLKSNFYFPFCTFIQLESSILLCLLHMVIIANNLFYFASI